MKKESIVLGGLILIAMLVVSIPLLGFIVGPGDVINENNIIIEEDIIEEEVIEQKVEEEEKDVIVEKDVAEEEAIEQEIVGTVVIMQTTKGDIKIELFDEAALLTVANFKSLIEADFYDDIIFHRVIDGFMVQAGHLDIDGVSRPAETIDCEFYSRIENYRGTLSMANAGLNTGNSQFFINLVDNHHLDGGHTVFGRVIEGMDIVDAIGATKVDGIRPVIDVVIEDIIIKNLADF